MLHPFPCSLFRSKLGRIGSSLTRSFKTSGARTPPGNGIARDICKGDDGIIEDAKFKTYGCGSAIASSSLVTEMVKGKSLDEALEIKNTQIVEELALPPVKIHCSVLAEDAIKAAIEDYKSKQAGAK